MRQLVLYSLWALIVCLLSACGDGSSATVSTTNPPNTAKGASLTQPITASFSRTVDPATVTIDSFTVNGPSGPVDGSVTATGNTVSFVPAAPLDYSTDYTARLTTAIKDSAGHSLDADYVWTFNTGGMLAAGQDHACTRLDDGRVKCWGDNSTGQFGLGDSNGPDDGAGESNDNSGVVDLGSDRIALALAAGADHTCAILDDGNVKCWGSNSSGQLGLGNTDNRGDDPGEMGDSLPAVELGTGRTALELVAGASHTCVRLDNGDVKCWGMNADGQLGLGDTDNRGDDPGEVGDSLPAVELGSGRTAVGLTAGDFHTCAQLDNGDVKCWGMNDPGGL